MFCTDDPNALDEWLTVGPSSAIPSNGQVSASTLLGCDLQLKRTGPGAISCAAGPDELMTQERYGYVWVCPSGRPARDLFDLPEYTQSGRRIVDCGGIGIATGALRIVENFLDMAHFPYVHTDLLGKVPRTEVMDYTVTADQETDELWALDCRFWQPRASASAEEGIEAAYKYRVMQPFTAALYKSCVPRPDELDAIALFVQPLGHEASIAYCLLLYFEEVLSDTELISFQQTIFAQDKPILEGHVLKRTPLEGRLETPTRADAMSIAYRRWLRDRRMTFSVLRS